MILADFTPQEVCTYLKLCPASVDVELIPPVYGERMDILTNEIPQSEEITEVKVETKMKPKASPVCILCEFVMEKVDESLRDNATEVNGLRFSTDGRARPAFILFFAFSG